MLLFIDFIYSTQQLIKIVRKRAKAAPQIQNYDTNERIRLNNFTVIDENGENLGRLDKFEAIAIAKERELDLVLVSPHPDNAVAKIVDWSKFKYEKSKKARKNQAKKIENKEWWFSPKIQDNEIEFKINQVKKFLEKEDGIAKMTVKYERKTTPDMLYSTFERVKAKFEEFAKPVSEMAREGRNLSIIIRKK